MWSTSNMNQNGNHYSIFLYSHSKETLVACWTCSNSQVALDLWSYRSSNAPFFRQKQQGSTWGTKPHRVLGEMEDTFRYPTQTEFNSYSLCIFHSGLLDHSQNMTTKLKLWAYEIGCWRLKFDGLAGKGMNSHVSHDVLQQKKHNIYIMQNNEPTTFQSQSNNKMTHLLKTCKGQCEAKPAHSSLRSCDFDVNHNE